jgi:hypothetical protein
MALNLSGTTGIVTGNIAALQVTTATIADANVTPGKLSQPMTLATAQNATGTSVDFTSIPSWAKRITVMFSGVSTNGTNGYLIQVGSGSFETSGYVGQANAIAAVIDIFGAGFLVNNNIFAANTYQGTVTLNYLVSNIWTETGLVAPQNSGSYLVVSAGKIALPGTLDRLRVTTVTGANTFDAGNINIMYEG